MIKYILLMGCMIVPAVANEDVNQNGIGNSVVYNGSKGPAVGPVSIDNDISSSSKSASFSEASAYSSNSSKSGVSINTNIPRTAPDVIMPALAAGINPCGGSRSVGGSGATFGFSIGSTARDKNCEVRALAQELAGMGYREAARQLLCQDKRVSAAYEAAGMPCSVIPQEAPKAEPVRSAVPHHMHKICK